MTTPARNLEIGRGFVRARECPDCFHTRCGEDCVCNCDAAHAEDEAAHLRSQVESLQSTQAERARHAEEVAMLRDVHLDETREGGE